MEKIKNAADEGYSGDHVSERLEDIRKIPIYPNIDIKEVIHNLKRRGFEAYTEKKQ